MDKLNQYLAQRPVRTIVVTPTEDLGNYLSVEDRKIILNSNKCPLIPLRFEDDQLARQMVVEINRLYGEHLEWLGWSGWLTDIRQIPECREDRLRFGRFVDELVKLNKTITQEDCVECWRKSLNA